MIWKRLMSGTLMVLALGAACYFLPAIGALVLLIGISTIALVEFYTMLGAVEIPSFRIFGLVCGAALISATFFSLAGHACVASGLLARVNLEGLALLLIVLSVILRQFPQKNNPKPVTTIACTLVGICYVPFLFNFFTKLIFGWEQVGCWSNVGTTGRLLVFYLVVVVKATDAGAFAIGKTLGRHKLFPRISPSKTWEGLAGGLLAGMGCSLGFFHLFHVSGDVAMVGKIAFQLRDAIILGILLPVAGVMGDLAESLFKRATGTKDSGHSIPGMGGLLDILDSLLFGAPILYYYVQIFMR
jgi:phosphatidate cytidylyltransferase